MSARLTRRSFVQAAAGSLLLPQVELGSVTGAERDRRAGGGARIRANAGMAWREKTIDGFKAGNPKRVVTGVSTTVMATRRVLARAIEVGAQPGRHAGAGFL